MASRLATGFVEVKVEPFCLFIIKNCNMVTRGHDTSSQLTASMASVHKAKQVQGGDSQGSVLARDSVLAASTAWG